MVYAGKPENGYFAEDYASKNKMSFAYVEPNPHIAEQVNEILRLGSQDYTIFEIESYIDDAEDIAEQITRICRANNSVPIIYASGYMLQSSIIQTLYGRGIGYFITASTLGEIKDQFEKCINGYFAVNGIDGIGDIAEPIEDADNRLHAANTKLIGVAGACRRIGTTTHCMQIIQYLQLKGYKACYIQISPGYTEACINTYEVEKQDDKIGCVTISGVDHYYNLDQINDVLHLDYDYFVYDYGVTSDKNLNRISFLEKDIKIFVLGIDATELDSTSETVGSIFYDNVMYIFNFVSEADRKPIMEMMGVKKERCCLAGFIPDKYTYVPTDIYEKIIPVENIAENQKNKKKRGFFGGRK